MTTNPVAPAGGYRPPMAVPRYALVPVHGGYDLAVATVTRMLDEDGMGAVARTLQPGEPVPLGAKPVLVATTTVYSTLCVENMLRHWYGLPRPWLVTVADVPADPPPAARYRIRALQGRLLGTANVPYLPVLREVESADQAIKDPHVRKAGVRLRRQLEGK